jgi:thioredoxin-related protein
MNEKPKQVFDAGNVIKKVGDIPTYLQFINNACLVEFIKQSFKDARKYDSFFLHKKDGEVKELWGYLIDIHTLLHMPIEYFY